MGVHYNRVEMKVLKPGDVFGHTSLANEPTKSPSYLSLDFTRFACITADDFATYLHEWVFEKVRKGPPFLVSGPVHLTISTALLSSEQDMDTLRFLQKAVPVLHGVRKTLLDDVAPYLVHNEFGNGHQLFLQGNPSVCLFFLKEVACRSIQVSISMILHDPL